MEYTTPNAARDLQRDLQTDPTTDQTVASSADLSSDQRLVRKGAVGHCPGPVIDADAQLAYFRRVALERFQISELHSHQEKILEELIRGRDVLAVMPTGSGKTLCYALPAACRDGLVLVVSPLIALMRDQVASLRKYGIPVAALDSLQTADEKKRIWDQIGAGKLKVLIVSPERLALSSFRARLGEFQIQLIAVDEAHCISQWGFHFRPEYRKVGEYLADLGDIQKIALTATATDRVRGEIRNALRLDHPAVLVADFNRENLELSVDAISNVADQLKAVVEATRLSPGSGIIYASTRKQVHEIHAALAQAGESATMYHAGLPAEARKGAYQNFMNGTVRVVVATNAFGLGIDKSDIRFVHHASLPASLEQYVQEIGRAGRDGQSASCKLIAGTRDYYVHRYMIDKGFPEVTAVRNSYQASCDILGTTQGQSEDTLMKHLRLALKSPDDELRGCVEVLLRDGLLVRHSMSGGYDKSYGTESLIGLGYSGDEEKKFWREYPLRKLDQLNRLDRMRTYASGTPDRVEFLNKYFRT